MTDDIEWTVDPKCIELDLGDGRIDFGHEDALAHLLINSVVFLNCLWHREDLPADAKSYVVVHVICSDTFGYACADCETLPWDQIETLYKAWRDLPSGVTAWCMKQRKAMPLRPIAEQMREEGWDLEALMRGEWNPPVRR